MYDIIQSPDILSEKHVETKYIEYDTIYVKHRNTLQIFPGCGRPCVYVCVCVHTQKKPTKQTMMVTFGKEIGIEVPVKRDFSFNFCVLIGCLVCVLRDLVKDESDNVTGGIFRRWRQP